MRAGLVKALAYHELRRIPPLRFPIPGAVL
jgi:hypothetical protein